MTVSTDVGRCFCGQLKAETEKRKGREEIRLIASGFLVIESFYHIYSEHFFQSYVLINITEIIFDYALSSAVLH